MDMNKKSLFKSKTFWLNLAAGVVAFAALLNKELLTQIGIPETAQNQIMGAVGLLVGAANIYLRLGITHEVKMPGKIKP